MFRRRAIRYLGCCWSLRYYTIGSRVGKRGPLQCTKRNSRRCRCPTNRIPVFGTWMCQRCCGSLPIMGVRAFGAHNLLALQEFLLPACPQITLHFGLLTQFFHLSIDTFLLLELPLEGADFNTLPPCFRIEVFSLQDACPLRLCSLRRCDKLWPRGTWPPCSTPGLDSKWSAIIFYGR